MGCQGLIVLTAFLLFIKGYQVSAQYATVLECRPQLTATVSRPVVQSSGQFVLPTVIQPILSGYDSYSSNQASSYSSYGNYPAPFPGYPPVIVRDSDDILRSLLYLMIFEMGSRRGERNTSPSYCGCNSCNCGCCGSTRCKCSCDCPYCSKNNTKDIDYGNSTPTYIPIPIAIPVYTGPDGCRYIEGFCDDILVQESNGQVFGGRDLNEINLIIRTE